MDSSEHQDDLSVGDVFTPQADSALSCADFPTNHHVSDVHMGDQQLPRKQMANDRTNGNSAMVSPAFKPNLLPVKPQRRKKNKKKQVGQVDPALSTVRGFTPLASADEDSDFSTTSSIPATSVCGSPSVHPVPLGNSRPRY
ncbi:hypothetical protein N7468_004452 [Penicillium chermesinum]|uniref:Uncharacterized protein n=1 Tax=Penicillium chermesinum TaxID=63820 RepID=A0A9W9PAX2_9EURO|nr:uncharacterized protein N7468_004452 [Penicillium chermesinum]KAJ5239833.1 hypothetical protein N7468_004452 [Penicillium chermesinum]